MGQQVESPIVQILERLHRRLAKSTDGEVASYIPELAKANPDWFGISIATLDGKVYEVGTTRQTFTIQSISKPLVYGLALEIHGTDRVGKFVGVEPTGDAFNSISLEEGTGRPLNPMINAGAIATSSLAMGSDPEESFARVLSTISGYAGRPLGIDETVFESERETGHRNRAIGHMLRNYDILTGNPGPALDLYFKQCSIELDCRDLALVGATLANGGLNPVTNQRVVKAEFVDKILSVMTTCGMYDFSGEWVYGIGMPAKSGVAGGIVAVLPGQLGIGVFSPPLDSRGNSARGVAACHALSQELGLHFLQPPRPSVSTLRSNYTLSNKRSRRRRPRHEIRLLDEFGGRVAIHELQGDLRFSTVERIVREIVERSKSIDYVVLDFKRVQNIDSASAGALIELAKCCTEAGLHLVFTRTRSDLLQKEYEAVQRQGSVISLRFESELDLTLEWCEEELLHRYSSTMENVIDGTRNRRRAPALSWNESSRPGNP